MSSNKSTKKKTPPPVLASRSAASSASPSDRLLNRRKNVKFSNAMRSFLGHLVGTEKADLTIRSYKSDLNTFDEYLRSGLGSRPVELGQLRIEDLEAYPGWLKARGYKTNTRRRKLLTARRLLTYLKKRKKIRLDAGQRIPTPHKVERIPHVVDTEVLREKLMKLRTASELEARNQALLWILLESGCLVSEVAGLRFDQLQLGETSGGARFALSGKSPRVVPISSELAQALEKLRKFDSRMDTPWIFHGFNRFGPLRSPMSSRGVELVVKAYGPKLGLAALLAKNLRASAVIRWAKEGVKREDIRVRLGLKTDYAFRAYDPLIRKALKEKEPAQD